jgi:hypothetical protein
MPRSGHVKIPFCNRNSWPDIAKKLQKLENWKDKNMEELSRESQRFM